MELAGNSKKLNVVSLECWKKIFISDQAEVLIGIQSQNFEAALLGREQLARN